MKFLSSTNNGCCNCNVDGAARTVVDAVEVPLRPAVDDVDNDDAGGIAFISCSASSTKRLRGSAEGGVAILSKSGSKARDEMTKYKSINRLRQSYSAVEKKFARASPCAVKTLARQATTDFCKIST